MLRVWPPVTHITFIAFRTRNLLMSPVYTRKLSARFARASTFLAPAESFLTTSVNLHRSTVTEALLEKDMS